MKKSIFFVCGLLVAISVNATHTGYYNWRGFYIPGPPHAPLIGPVPMVPVPMVMPNATLCYTMPNFSCVIPIGVSMRPGQSCSCINGLTGLVTWGVAQ